MRLAKAIAASRLCSRREAERLIALGRVSVNGHAVEGGGGGAAAAGPIAAQDRVLVDGKPLPRAPPARELFLAYKLRQELVTYSDPAGRPTLFQRLDVMGLPPNLVAVGRLDFMSEGLLLLTPSGELARKLELPDNGFVRKYRARVCRGEWNERAKRRLEAGIQVREALTGPYKPMGVRVMYEQRERLPPRARDGGGARDGGARGGARSADLKREKREEQARREGSKSLVKSQWLDVSVTEGKYREVRRALAEVGLMVDRLVRTDFGPYSLGSIPRGSVLKVSSGPLMRALREIDAAKAGGAQQVQVRGDVEAGGEEEEEEGEEEDEDEDEDEDDQRGHRAADAYQPTRSGLLLPRPKKLIVPRT
jgi:23S rRNA pseudouridine2605 synthase